MGNFEIEKRLLVYNPRGIIFDFFDSHGVQNNFGDGLKFVENPFKYKICFYILSIREFLLDT